MRARVLSVRLSYPLLALQTEGAVSQELQAASRSWKGDENKFSPETPERNMFLLITLILI